MIVLQHRLISSRWWEKSFYFIFWPRKVFAISLKTAYPQHHQAAFDEHNENEKKQAANPEGGPYDAYGGGKAWDKYGKKYYHNGPNSVEDAYHVSIVTPVVHYTMGGMKVTPAAQAQCPNDKVIPGLYGAGEVNGGIHGENRLGGSSLLDCVVYGRVAGRSACKYLMEYNIGAVRAKI